MAKYKKEDIFRMVEEEDVEFIRLQFTDMFGMLKNVAITAGQLEKALNNRCVFDGSAIEGFVREEETDMYLHPDLDTFTIFPWRPQQGKVARLVFDVYGPDGTPFEGDPRYILKKVLKEAEEFKGPSLIIAYAPCINHGLKASMGKSQAEEKKAVECGYWQLYRYNPALEEEGKNPFQLDSKEPDYSKFRDYLMGEVRFNSLLKAAPEEAEKLFAKTQSDAKWRYEGYKRRAEMKYGE